MTIGAMASLLAGNPHMQVVPRSQTAAPMGYVLFTPTVPAEKHPLLVFLHGLGESGDSEQPLGMFDPDTVALVPYLLAGFNLNVDESFRPRKNGTRLECPEVLRQFFVLCPRTPVTNVPHAWQAPELDAFMTAFLHQDAERLQLGEEPVARRIDTSRLYVTGCSMGGLGAFRAAATGWFAAAAPVCAARTAVDNAAILKNGCRVWTFHGANDRMCSCNFSDDAMAALFDGGPLGVQEARDTDPLLKTEAVTYHTADSRLQYTKYARTPDCDDRPGDGHAAWIPAYTNPALYEWLLRWSKSSRADL